MERNDALFDAIAEALEAGRSPETLSDDLWARFGETAAVLVLDSTGFTRTTRTRGIAFFLTAISRLRTVTWREVHRYGATSWRAEADNVFASFPDVDHAISASFAIHRVLADDPILIGEDEALGACIGIGWGRLLRSDREGYYGDEMNLASKLGEDTAKAGETLLTDAAYEALTHAGVLDARQHEISISGVDIAYWALSPTG